jgi:hypothetical protein
MQEISPNFLKSYDAARSVKKRDLDRTEAFIAEETKADLALFEEINVLK